MTTMQGIPHGASIAIDDMLDQCAQIREGQEVLILAQIDGFYGGDNLGYRERPARPVSRAAWPQDHRRVRLRGYAAV